MQTKVVHILTHNRKDTLRRCLQALVAADVSAHADVLVVDNASTDGTESILRQEFPYLNYLKLDDNYGVSGGRNRGLAYLSGDWNVFLDDDCLVEPEFFLNFGDAIKRGDAGDILTFRIIQDDTEAITCWSYYPPASQYHSHRFEAHIFSGGGCAIRNNVFQSIGPLSEAFVFGAEEVNYSLRAISAGFIIAYEPAIVVRHVGLARHPFPTERDLMHIETISYFYLMLLPGLSKWLMVASCLMSSYRPFFHFGIAPAIKQVYKAWQKACQDGPSPLPSHIWIELKRLQQFRPCFFIRVVRNMKAFLTPTLHTPDRPKSA